MDLLASFRGDELQYTRNGTLLKEEKKMKIFIVILLLVMSVSFAHAADITKTFAWDAPTDLELITKWELHWSGVEGGPYTKVTEIPKVADQTVFEAPATVDIIGPPGTTQTRYFVLTACGDVPSGDTTEFKCSDNSNEVNFSVYIPTAEFNVPVNFRIKDDNN